MKRASLLTAACGSALLLAGTPFSRQALAVEQTPQVSAGQAAPVAHPYDAPQNARAAVDAAFEQARTTNKRVLIDFGANWCPDCPMLAGVLQLTQVQPWIGQNFVPV